MYASQPGLTDYGAVPAEFGPEPSDKVFRKTRRTFGAGACITAIFIPVAMFAMMFSVASFSIGYKYPGISTAVELLGVGIAFYFGYSALLLQRRNQDESWFLLLFATSLIAVVAAAELGYQNLEKNMRPFYDIVGLNIYPAVDPATTTGSQVMDAGRFVFVPGSHVDTRHSMGFKNGDSYCVAPIVSSNYTAEMPAGTSTYDFWAVGINCCTPHLPDFHCGEFSNPSAQQGLRLMSDTQRSFYRLAVQQAEAAYSITASHPIFLEWMSSPENELNAFRDDGFKVLMTLTLAFAAFQTLATVGACVFFAKRG